MVRFPPNTSREKRSIHSWPHRSWMLDATMRTFVKTIIAMALPASSAPTNQRQTQSKIQRQSWPSSLLTSTHLAICLVACFQTSSTAAMPTAIQPHPPPVALQKSQRSFVTIILLGGKKIIANFDEDLSWVIRWEWKAYIRASFRCVSFFISISD